MNRRNLARSAAGADPVWWLVPLLFVLAMLAAGFLVGLLEQMPGPDTPLASAQPAR